MKRFFNWIKGLFNRLMDRVEDPEMMLDQARREMEAARNANREKAVQAITQKNRLKMMLDEASQKSNQLESQAIASLKQGNRDLARGLLREKTGNDATMKQLQTAYEQSLATVEQVKVAIKRQEEEVRKKTAEALAMKAQWKQAQIQNSISKALEGLTFENQLEGFGAAADKIKTAQSEAAARQEMLQTSLQGQVQDMEDKAMDYEAEAELQKLEERLGMRESAPAAEETEQVQVTEGGGPTSEEQAEEAALQSEADKQLDELEKRIEGNQS